jgi:hypothetical protein
VTSEFEARDGAIRAIRSLGAISLNPLRRDGGEFSFAIAGENLRTLPIVLRAVVGGEGEDNTVKNADASSFAVAPR